MVGSHNTVHKEGRPKALSEELEVQEGVILLPRDRRKTDRIDDNFHKTILISEYINTMKPVVVPKGSFEDFDIKEASSDNKRLSLYFCYHKEKGLNKNIGNRHFFLFDQDPPEMLNDLLIKVNFDKIERYRKTPVCELGEKTYYIYVLKEGCKLL